MMHKSINKAASHDCVPQVVLPSAKRQACTLYGKPQSASERRVPVRQASILGPSFERLSCCACRYGDTPSGEVVEDPRGCVLRIAFWWSFVRQARCFESILTAIGSS